MHNAIVTAALLAVAFGTTGCMHGMGMMNMLTLGLLGMPVPAQGEAVASSDAPTTYVSNTTYVTDNYHSSGSSSTGSSRAPRSHHSHHRY